MANFQDIFWLSLRQPGLTLFWLCKQQIWLSEKNIAKITMTSIEQYVTVGDTEQERCVYVGESGMMPIYYFTYLVTMQLEFAVNNITTARESPQLILFVLTEIWTSQTTGLLI